MHVCDDSCVCSLKSAHVLITPQGGRRLKVKNGACPLQVVEVLCMALWLLKITVKIKRKHSKKKKSVYLSN